MVIVMCDDCCGYDDGDDINTLGDANDACV